MLLRKDPLLCDVTVVNDVRAVLYEGLAARTSILDAEQKVTALSTWPMAVAALERLQRFFSVSQAADCAFAYPTLLYLPALDTVEASGYHFSAPPLLPMVRQRHVHMRGTSIHLNIPRVELSADELGEAGYFIERAVDGELSSNWKKLSAALHQLYKEATTDKSTELGPFQAWHSSRIVALHTYAVADTAWNNDLDKCTVLQQRILSTRFKHAELRADSRYEIIPRGLAYFGAARSRKTGLCHSRSRDYVLNIFLRQRAEIIDDIVYSKARLSERFEDVILDLLENFSGEPDAENARYCRGPVDAGPNKKPDITTIDQDRIRRFVDEWESRAWGRILRELLLRPDLKENRVKTIAYTLGSAFLRWTLAPLSEILPNKQNE